MTKNKKENKDEVSTSPVEIEGGDIPQDKKNKSPLFTKNQTAHFQIDGMYCPDCASSIEASLSKEPGIKQVTVSFAGEQGRVDYDPKKADLKTSLDKLKSIGYHARLTTDIAEQKADKERENLLLQVLVAFGFGMQVMIIYLTQLYPLYVSGTMVSKNLLNLSYVVWALATPVLFIGGSSFLKGAWKSIKVGKAGMNTLVSLGTLSAYGYSVYVTLSGGGEIYFDSVVMITTFIMLGRYLEKLGGAQARKDIRHLLRLQPDYVTCKVDGEWVKKPVNQLNPGALIMIKPGERIAADAQVKENSAAVDESLLTGESAPVQKHPGDNIFAGTSILDSMLIAEVIRVGKETRLGQITKIVETTLNQKPPIQKLADKASRYFAWGIVGISVVTFIGWWLAGNTPSVALLHAVAVLVVACPCALGLATPLAVAVSLGKTAQKGLLVRNPSALEMAAKINRVVFDKTGTLTQGRLSIVDVVVDNQLNLSREDFLCIAASVEQFSEHPLAKSIVQASDCSNPQAKDFHSGKGRGVSARVEKINDEEVKIGAQDFVGKEINDSLQADAEEHHQKGETVVWIGWQNRCQGFIAFHDEINASAPETLKTLVKMSVKSVMVSGDDPRTVQTVAAMLEMSDFHGGVTPEEKAADIKSWQGAKEKVAMIGDGVNDAPALAQADLSITTASGTDVAGETSDVVLTRDDLTVIPWFISFSQKTNRIIRENLGWAFAYNIISVPLAAFGIISPVIAAVAMASSSLLVVGNSLRLKR